MRLPMRRRPVEIELPEFGISAFTSRHAPSFSMPICDHDYHKLCFVEAGEGWIDDGTRRVELSSAAVARIPPGQPHRFVDDIDAPMTVSILCFGEGAFASSHSASALWCDVCELLPALATQQIDYDHERCELQELFRAVVFEMGQQLPHRAVAVYALATRLLTLVARSLVGRRSVELPKTPRGFAASVAYLEGRFTEDLRIEDLARQAGLSYRAYTERFRKHTGMTVTQYIIQQRLEFAKRRMLETEDILGSALEAGFQDLSHFYRTFKRRLGETPQSFIHRNLASAESDR